MEVDWFYRIAVLFILLLFSAFFSGSEVALFSLDKKKIKDLKKKGGLTDRYIINLLDNQRRLLVTILLGNTIFNVAASIVGVWIAMDAASVFEISVDLALLIQIIALTLIILLFGEVTPKVWASKYPLQFSRICSIPLYWISVLIYPVSKILTDTIKTLASRIKYDKSKTAILTSEIQELADLGVEKGTIEEDEHELLQGLVSFKTVTVREVMTPRVDVVAVSNDTNFDELMKIITESGHSRIPLYDEDLDDIIGVIYAKDLLKFIRKKEEQVSLNLKSIARSAMFIPETKLINELMHEFQEKNMHMGIVVDEYGGTSGLVSLEDILEEIVGDIWDEFDTEENEITRIDDNTYMILGKVSIDEMNELLEFDFSSENDDYDTIAGFIYNLAGKIPEKDFTATFNDFQFIVKEVINRRINKILVRKPGSKNKDD